MKKIFRFILLSFIAILFSSNNSQGQIPTADMETWQESPLSGENPVGWWTSNGDLLPYNVLKDSIEKHSGNYSAQLTNIVGAWGSMGTGFTTTVHPDFFTGYYKFLFQTTDTATIYLKLYYNHVVTDSGQLIIDSPAASWTQFSISLSGQSSPVDSAAITVVACKHVQDQFWIDDLDFSMSNFIAEEKNYSFSIYPNPADSKLLIEPVQTLSNAIDITDILGRRVMHLSPATFEKNDTKNSFTELDISIIPPGIYFIEIAGEKKMFIIQR